MQHQDQTPQPFLSDAFMLGCMLTLLLITIVLTLTGAI